MQWTDEQASEQARPAHIIALSQRMGAQYMQHLPHTHGERRGAPTLRPRPMNAIVHIVCVTAMFFFWQVLWCGHGGDVAMWRSVVACQGVPVGSVYYLSLLACSCGLWDVGLWLRQDPSF